MHHHNPYVECPYNKAHQVPKLRLQYHLVKCRKQYPVTEMKVCPFNATHILPEAELKMHLRDCSERCLIEGQKYNFLSAEHGNLGNPTFHPDVPMEEDWEDTKRQKEVRFYHGVQEFAEGLRKNQHGSSQNSRSPSNVSVDEFSPGGALGVSRNIQPENGVQNAMTSSSIGKRYIGMGRGQINLVLAEMKRGARS